jgi:hypothetical protein
MSQVLNGTKATHELVVIDAVCCVALNSSDCRFAGVEGDDIVDQSLALRTELDRLGGIGRVVLRRRCLTNFKLFSWLARHGLGRLVNVLCEMGRMCERIIAERGIDPI